MGVNFSPRESSELFRLLAENTADIILKTDIEGFIVEASPALGELGIALPNMLIGPHIVDLAHPSCADAVRAAQDAAIGGKAGDGWTEFLALTAQHKERWFELRMRSLTDEQGRIYGALGVMRSAEERRAYEERLFAATMTDQLTGLTNRKAFIAMLQHLVDRDIDGCVAIFDIDHFKAVNMQFGQSIGDEVLVIFADLVRMLMRSEDIISRIGGESLGVLLPHAAPDQAEAICQRVIATLADRHRAAGADSPAVTASAGIARIAGSLDDTLRRAELALLFAKGRGRSGLHADDGARMHAMPKLR